MLLLLLVSKQVIGGRIVRQYGLHCEGIDYKSMLCYLASIWTIAVVVISNRFNAKTKHRMSFRAKKPLPK